MTSRQNRHSPSARDLSARSRTWTGSPLVSTVTALGLVVLLSGCIKSSKGSIESFKADSGNAWEYLIERSVNLGDSSSGYGSGASSMSSYAAMDQSMPGSSAALVGSLDSMGLCYWYTKIEKTGPLDYGYKLDLSDGTPNLGIRNYLIARAGVPLTNNIVRMTDVLQAMNDAGGELKRIQGEIAEANVKLHKVLMDAMAPTLVGVGGGTVGLAALGQQGRRPMVGYARNIFGGMNKFQSGTFDVNSAPVGSVTEGKVGFNQLNFVRPQSLGKNSPIPNEKNLVAVRTFHRATKDGPQVTQVIITETGDKFFRQSRPKQSIRLFSWKKLDNPTIAKLGITDAKLLDEKTLFKNFGKSLAAVRIAGRNASVGLARKAVGVVDQCNKGSALVKASCLAVVGAVAAGAYTWNNLSRKGSDRVNDAVIAQKVGTVLQDPQVVQNVAQIMQEFEKEKNISARLLDELRKQLYARSAASTLGSCNEMFGTEIMTTPGVAGTNYESQFGSITTGMSGATDTTSLSSMPATPATSMTDTPVYDDTGNLTSSDPSLSSDGTLPSTTDPVGVAGSATDFSSDTSTPQFDDSLATDSSTDSSTTSGSDANSL